MGPRAISQTYFGTTGGFRVGGQYIGGGTEGYFSTTGDFRSGCYFQIRRSFQSTSVYVNIYPIQRIMYTVH